MSETPGQQLNLHCQLIETLGPALRGEIPAGTETNCAYNDGQTRCNLTVRVEAVPVPDGVFNYVRCYDKGIRAGFCPRDIKRGAHL